MTHTYSQPSTIGIDLAKNIFHLHGLDPVGNTLWKKTTSRPHLLTFLSKFNPCIIGIEACGGSHYWHRTFSQLGFEVHMITPQRAKAFVEGQKNDKNDAEAIAHAVMSKHTRLVSPKTTAQQEIGSIHAMRNIEIKQRTQRINHMRGTLNEYGITFQKGAKKFENEIEGVLERLINDASFPKHVREGLLIQVNSLKELQERIKVFDEKIKLLSQSDVCQRLMTVPGIGPITSTMMEGHFGSAEYCKSSRDCAASLGLVPRQHSTGGKQSYGGISKRGNVGLRSNLIHGARSFLLHSVNKRKKEIELPNDAFVLWALKCYDRLGCNKAAVAIANKIARISWKIIRTPGEVFTPARLDLA